MHKIGGQQLNSSIRGRRAIEEETKRFVLQMIPGKKRTAKGEAWSKKHCNLFRSVGKARLTVESPGRQQKPKHRFEHENRRSPRDKSKKPCSCRASSGERGGWDGKLQLPSGRGSPARFARGRGAASPEEESG
jgi:hypothetical protein